MTKVVADITMSLDGYVTGPDPDVEHGLGHGGEPLHDWVMDPDDVDARELQTSFDRSGAVIMGRNLFDVVDAPEGWSDEMGYGAQHAGRPPFFVVTHSRPEAVRLQLDFTFVTGGVTAAVEQARPAAGEKDVFIMGGGDVIAQAIEAGVVDELNLHIAPMVVGDGVPLFRGLSLRQFRQSDVRVSRNANHVTYALD
jgi:dihydrofolate reductase